MGMIEIPDPPGYRVVRYGPANVEWWINCDGRVRYGSTSGSYIILEPVEVWRDARIEDLRRVPLKCRVRDDEHEPWLEPRVLHGYVLNHSGKRQWYTDSHYCYTYCQVLEEPQCASKPFREKR